MQTAENHLGGGGGEEEGLHVGLGVVEEGDAMQTAENHLGGRRRARL